MNVGKNAYARTKLLVVLDGKTLLQSDSPVRKGKSNTVCPEIKRGSFGKSPGPWFNPYSANFEQEIQEFFAQIEYKSGGYTIGGTTLRLPELRHVLRDRINTALIMNSPSGYPLQLKDILFLEFIIQSTED